MKKKPFKFVMMAALSVLCAAPCLAQEEVIADACSATMTEMTTLRDPYFGAAASVWDIVEGDEGMEVYADVIPLEGNNFIAAGTFTKDKEAKAYHPLIVRFDDMFKKVWETRDLNGAYKTIERIVPVKNGYAVLGNTRDANGNGFYVGFYDEKGKRKKETPVYERGGSVEGKAFAQASDGSGFLVAAQFVDGKDGGIQYGMIYKFSSSGQQMWKRSYRPGRSSVFENIQPTLNGEYLVTGQLVTDDNKSAGWVLRIDNKGIIGWQQTYPRGLSATLNAAAQTKDGAMILSGQIRPLAGTKHGLAAWIMKTNSAGRMEWQRYFKSENYDLSAEDSVVYEDGRASVLINGTGLAAEYISHARLLTFSPLGQLQLIEEFTNGQNALARRLVAGLDGERILAGRSQTSFGENQDLDAPAPDYTLDGWLLAAVPLELYEDPCDIPMPDSPILP